MGTAIGQVLPQASRGKAVGAGAVLSGANPKNLLLAIGAAAAIAQRLQQLIISAGTPR
jgi:hypothetical protein